VTGSGGIGGKMAYIARCAISNGVLFSIPCFGIDTGISMALNSGLLNSVAEFGLRTVQSSVRVPPDQQTGDMLDAMPLCNPYR